MAPKFERSFVSMIKRIKSGMSWLKFTFIPVTLCFCCFVIVSCGDGQKKPASHDSDNKSEKDVFQDWPIFRRDAELQGESVEDLKYPLELAWSFEPEVEEGKRRYPFIASPVISDGVVYVGNQDGKFFAIDLESGQSIWEFQAGDAISGPAAVYGTRVFFGDTGGIFYALNAEGGQEAWRFEADDKIEGGVNILKSQDGKIRLFFGSHDYFLYCLNAADGSVLWKHETENYIMATPSIVNSAGQQAVSFGGCDGVFHIVPADGTGDPKSIEVGSYIANSSSVRDGIAYVAHNGGEVLAVEIESGETVWKVDTGQEYRGSAAVGEKLLFVPSPDKKLTAYDRVTGDEVWTFLGRRAFDSSPIITKSAIWQAGVDGYLYAVNPADGTELWSWDVGAKIKASPAISHGFIILCGDDGVVYAFRASPIRDDK